MKVKILDLDTVKRTAHILGDSSAAAQALKEFRKRKDNGEDVALYQADDKGSSILLVGPAINLGAGFPG